MASCEAIQRGAYKHEKNIKPTAVFFGGANRKKHKAKHERPEDAALKHARKTNKHLVKHGNKRQTRKKHNRAKLKHSNTKKTYDGKATNTQTQKNKLTGKHSNIKTQKTKNEGGMNRGQRS